MSWARREEWVVVSQDLDFSALLAVGGHSRPSLVSVRLSDSDPGTVSRRLLEILPLAETDLHGGAIVVIEDSSYRVRRLPIT